MVSKSLYILKINRLKNILSFEILNTQNNIHSLLAARLLNGKWPELNHRKINDVKMVRFDIMVPNFPNFKNVSLKKEPKYSQ